MEGGHAIVGYAATPTGLWVADPNYPGKLRHIAWNAKTLEFHPYDSGPTAADSDHHYDLIGLLGKTALIEWDAIGARWAELDAGTIGADQFPAVTVEIEVTAADGTNSYEALKPGPIATMKPLLGFSSVPGVTLRATFYQGSELIRRVGDGNVAPVPLAFGINDLGVLIESQFGTEWRFVDFQRFDLVAPAPSGMPTLTPSTPEPEPTFDCSVKPSGGIAELDWALHCEKIQPISTPGG